MASVVLAGNTSGSVTLSPPAVAGSNTVTIPAATGNALLDVASSISTNGYVKLSNGLIIQWGRSATGSDSTAVTFPIAFPTACLNVSVSYNADVASSSNAYSGKVRTYTTTGATFATNGAPFFWIAIGN
jgi:hypothetical protein